MGIEITKDAFSRFAYEIVERIIRFIIHLEEIEAQFYSDRSKFGTKAELIDNYKITLYELLKGVLVGYKSGVDGERNKYFGFLKKILESTNILHTEYLSKLPRPNEPVELVRFARVIDKQVVTLTDREIKKEILISFNESIGEEAEGDYLYGFKAEAKKIFEEYGIDYDIPEKPEEKLYVTIPRIDASNTFRWPSLIHEICHDLFSKVDFEEGSIENDFLNYIGDKKNDIVVYFEKNDYSLEKWLKECWCDLFACILIGPSFYFSEFLAFLNVQYHVTKNHPPHTLRLDLIESIIQHRFNKLHKDILEKYIAPYEEILEIMYFHEDKLENEDVLKDNSSSNLESTLLYNTFNLFFLSHFLSNNEVTQLKGNPKINEKLASLISKYVRIDTQIITLLKNRLDEGLPIPSIRTEPRNDEYEELPTYVQEIFLASWLSRSDVLVSKVLVELGKIDVKNNYDKKNIVYQNIMDMIMRHDQAVLKSIQVSEWFGFLNDEKERPDNIVGFCNKPCSSSLEKNVLEGSGILVDFEIKNLILQDELKIIPVVLDMKQQEDCKRNSQIGTTSIDIRLGSSFQIFYPDRHGIIDFVEGDDENNNFLPVSKRINLDFSEGLTIIPGQFLLGHSMEYIKLPDYISGSLEGRSSFARLGIEIHMTAGNIDPGFEGVLTFEICNAGNTAVKLYPGMRIAQIRLERNNEPKAPYSKKHTVKYKGLLEHNITRQNNDFEVELIREYRKKNKSK